MKKVDITELTNLYASFMRIKENPGQIDIQILDEASKSSKGDGED